jgi:uncharacterized protein (UPF0332 family)
LCKLRLIVPIVCGPEADAFTSFRDAFATQFDQVFVKPAIFGKEYSRWLHEAFLRRQSVDYGAEVTVSRDEIDTLLAHAREFLTGVRQYLDAHPPQGV